jgi:hypothetical protein
MSFVINTNIYKQNDNGISDGKNQKEFGHCIVPTKQCCYCQSNSNGITKYVPGII